MLCHRGAVWEVVQNFSLVKLHSKRVKHILRLLYSGKFSWGSNICDFRDPWPKHKKKEPWKLELSRAICVLVSLGLMVALYRYFKMADDVSTLSHGTYFTSFSLATIKVANEAVKKSILTLTLKLKRAYMKYTPMQQAQICLNAWQPCGCW